MSNYDDRNDWAKNFLNSDDFTELMERGEQVVSNSEDGIPITIAVTNSDCILLCHLWDKANRGDTKGQIYFHNVMRGFIQYLEDYLIECDIDWRQEPDML
jgi:hypothetical protein